VATLALTVERRGRRRSSELSASTITDCARLTSGSGHGERIVHHLPPRKQRWIPCWIGTC
jgi:hypothetical protein